LRRASLALCDLPPQCTVALINQSENTTYKVSAPGNRHFALRIHRPGYHSLTAINSELELR
jgi:Ser/Thr protein kinase RdoA (MazF antagonist)